MSNWNKFRKFWFKYSRVVIGGTMFAIIVLAAILAPIITTYEPTTMDVVHALDPPSRAHICGTDEFGRDVFARIIYGARVSLTVSLSVLVGCGVLGSILGLLAGYYKWADAIIMR